MGHFALFPTHGLSLLNFLLFFLLVLVGYWVSVVLDTWSRRSTYFLTLFLVSVIGHSLIGVAVTAPEAIICVYFFEREQRRRRQKTNFNAARSRRFAGFPNEKWDGLSPIVVFDANEYLFDESQIRAYLESQNTAGEEPRLCACDPVFLREIDTFDLTLGAERTLEPTVQKALDHLNEMIQISAPISWMQRDAAIDLHDLRIRVFAADRSARLADIGTGNT